MGKSNNTKGGQKPFKTGEEQMIWQPRDVCPIIMGMVLIVGGFIMKARGLYFSPGGTIWVGIGMIAGQAMHIAFDD